MSGLQRFFATCAKGLEYLLVDELRGLGAGVAHETLAGVHFEGELALAYRACLWSRLASRILLPLAEFDAADDAMLYNCVREIDWAQHLTPGGTLAVDAALSKSQLEHARFVEQRVKDAVVDQFRDACGVRPSVDTVRPDVRINLALRRDRAVLSLDLSGASLHRRGWRQGQGGAPLKENLACAVLLRAGWPEIYRAGGSLLDPMCGSGTLLIEGARMAAEVAPGLQREDFGLLRWRGHDPVLWDALRTEARQRAEAGLVGLRPIFFGFDHDPGAIAIALRNAHAAGVAAALSLRQGDVQALVPPAQAQTGLVVCNPPYDERLSADVALYRAFGATLKRHFAGWRAAVLTSDEGLGRALGLSAEKRYALYNGALQCTLLRIDRIDAPSSEPREAKALSEGAQMLANRLRRNLRTSKAWRRRENVSCYRLYDADLPEYAAAIDVYAGTPEADAGKANLLGFPYQVTRSGFVPARVLPPQPRSGPAGPSRSRPLTEGADRQDPLSLVRVYPITSSAAQLWLHIQEYQPPSHIPVAIAQQRLQDLVRAAMHVMQVPRARLALKTRQRGKGGGKYGRFDHRGEFLIIHEGASRLRVNLFDYLDTGVFLDHRPLRLRIATQAQGRRVLNLFCYAGAATVHAALGGALATTSVDLSATYLDWCARNLALNGIGGTAHRLVQADALHWLEAERGQYDLIFCDPPTFSNSARAADFDLQHEHARLIRAAMARLAPSGLLLFSNNFRRFRFDSALEAEFAVLEISAQTLAPDFARNPRIHRTWEIRHRGN